MQKRMLAFSRIFLVVVVLTGCDTLLPTSIAKVLQNPRSYQGTEVTVAGRVRDAFSLMVIKCFVIRDETGEITVITERPLPKKGEQTKVTGRVEEAFSLGDKQLIVIMENPPKR